MSLLRELFEASEKKAKVGTKERDKVNLDDLMGGPKSKGDLAEPKAKSHQRAKSDTKLKTSSAQRTRDRAASATVHDAPSINTDELDMDSEMSDDEAAVHAGHSTSHTVKTPGMQPKPVTPNTLPAIISKAMVTMSKGVATIEPEWHMVKHLPGYMSRAIRALGRQVFSPFTKTPIEEIQVVAHVGGGPNSEAEVDVVSKYVSGHGTRDKVAELAFKKVIPDYSAQVVAYNCDDITFFMVKDFAGHYIYAWPEKDSKDVAAPRGIEQERKALAQDRKQIGHDSSNEIDDLMKKYGL